MSERSRMGGSGSTIGLPAELRDVKGKILEDYVRSRILDFASEPGFAKRLYASPAVVRAAAQTTLAELARPGSAEGERGSKNLKLVFRHTCLSLGCLDNECTMCQNTPHRRCVGNFAVKYLSGDSLKAKCGANIFVEVIDQSTGQQVGQEVLEGLHIEICILEGKSYSEAAPEAATEAFLDANTLLVNAQGKELLAPGRGTEHTSDKRVVARFAEGKAELSVNILGSSIAMLTGQKPPFRLLVRAIDSNSGTRVAHVHHAVSDAFVVATQRVKGAQKAEIPHVEEHVSKIENVGVQTQHKLQDIRAAAQTAGITGLNVVHNTVTTVGQFKSLVESCAKDVPLQETLRKVLNFTSKGWEAAKAHALRAVETDNRMRIWLSDDSHSQGLLYRCNLGRVDLDVPVGILSGKGSLNESSPQIEMEAMLAQHPAYDRVGAAWLQQRAFECWWRPGHPGWSIWPADSEQFIRGVVEAGEAILSPVQIIAPIPATPHASYMQSASNMLDDASARSRAHPSASAGPGNSEQRSQQQPTRSVSTDGRSHIEDGRRASLTGLQGAGPVSQEHQGNRSSSLPVLSNLPPVTSSDPVASAGPPRNMRNGAWPFNIPLVNGQPMRASNPVLPASPFDVPMTVTAPASGGPVNLSQLESFSFRPGGTSRIGAATVHSTLPNHLPTLSTQELEQIMELQRRMSSEMAAKDSSTQQLPMSLLSNFAPEHGNQDQRLPQLLTRLSDLINNPNAANEEGSGGGSNNNTHSNSMALLAPLVKFQQAIQQEHQHEQRVMTSGADGEAAMPLRFSGKVSGILDDLSDAMSMLHDLLPSAASDVHLQMQAAKSAPEAQTQSDATFTSFPMPNLTSFTLPKAPPLDNVASAEGSNGLTDVTGGFSSGQLKRRRLTASK